LVPPKMTKSSACITRCLWGDFNVPAFASANDAFSMTTELDAKGQLEFELSKQEQENDFNKGPEASQWNLF